MVRQQKLWSDYHVISVENFKTTLLLRNINENSPKMVVIKYTCSDCVPNHRIFEYLHKRKNTNIIRFFFKFRPTIILFLSCWLVWEVHMCTYLLVKTCLSWNVNYVRFTLLVYLSYMINTVLMCHKIIRLSFGIQFCCYKWNIPSFLVQEL